MVVEDRRQIVYVSGSLRANQWPVIRTTAYLVYERYPLGVAIDFSGVRWVSAAGESTLIAALHEIEQHTLPFTLLNFSSAVEPLLSASVSRRLAEGTEQWWNRLCGTA
jgi:anti-anti-sigma regulatory factor